MNGIVRWCMMAGLVWLTSAALSFTLIFFVALANPPYQAVTVAFNLYGEGLLELVLVVPGTVIGTITGIWLIVRIALP